MTSAYSILISVIIIELVIIGYLAHKLRSPAQKVAFDQTVNYAAGMKAAANVFNRYGVDEGMVRVLQSIEAQRLIALGQAIGIKELIQEE